MPSAISSLLQINLASNDDNFFFGVVITDQFIKLVSPRFKIFFFPEDKIASTTVEPDLGSPMINIGSKFFKLSVISFSN